MADDLAATGLGRRRRQPIEEAAPDPSSGSPDETRPGNRRRPPRPDDGAGAEGVVRFGPGVPTDPPRSPTWSSPTSLPRRRRSRSWVGGLLTLVAVAAFVAWLLTRQATPLGVRAVAVSAPAEVSCGATVDVVGTVTTDGTGGTFRYQWTRSDGQTSDVLSQTVPHGATTTQVHLQWAVSGQGRFDGRATLRVLDPAAVEGSGGFRYACP